MIKILVTGATGFIGRELCLALAGKGYQVRALCRNTNHPYLIKHKNIVPVQGDILYPDSLKKAMQDCTQVYHTAALAKMWCRNPDAFYDTNVIGTRNVLSAATNAGVAKLVYTSTCGVWGPTLNFPLSEDEPRIVGFPIVYERTKYLAELEVQQFVNQGLNVVTVNPSRVFGEGPVTDSNTVSKMVSGYLRGKWRIIPGNGEQVANYAYLPDVVNGHIAAMEKGLKGNRYILGGEDISFNQFFSTVGTASGIKHRMLRVPQKAIKLYSHVEQFKTRLTGLPPFFLPEFADRLKFDQKYSSQKAAMQLGYRITPFGDAMQKTVDYLKQT
ncbi:NAD-dependent epimerase/dehydratase family protein [Mucilaginibacter sp. ZT4R22]|uniref:NAD-dependent epimerase/dehydratase family protein n=1 Tax=Mucilaginibacter pankratovii TaxID=2772110 RepID=A0ABR7WT21_9SPHI|nr:NAD-dependent epimerase/dehydratase family protein [Mucilaginibacter pankratovii]MBD1365459.1 NAD-dependent epimerase/dehydratase family protein [Mucilaginibacter pankratovii]